MAASATDWRLASCAALIFAAVGWAEPPNAAQIGQSDRLDRYGDPLPDGSIARLGTIKFRLGGPVTSMALSPDGKWVLAATGTDDVGVMDAESGRHRKLAEGMPEKSRIVAVSPDGTTFATAANESNRAIVFRSLDNGRQRLRVPIDLQDISCIAFSPDSSVLAFCGRYGESIRLINAKSGAKIRDLSGKERGYECLVFSPDGKSLAAGGDDGSVRIWNVASGTQVRQLPCGQITPSTIAYSPDGKTLASAGGDGKIRLWNTTTGKEAGSLASDSKDIQAISFLTDGKLLAAGSRDGRLTLWDVGKKCESRRLCEHSAMITSLQITKDGKRIYASVGRAIRVWDVAAGREITPAGCSEGAMYCLAFTPDGGSVIAAGTENSINAWDLKSGVPRRLAGHEDYVFSVAVSPDGKTLASAGGKPFLRLQSLATDGRLDGLNVAHVYAFCVSFSPDGRMLAASDREQSVHIVDVATGKVRYRLKPDETEIYATAFSPDRTFVASGGNARSVHITNLTTRNVRSFATQTSDIHGLAFSPDGRTLAATGDQNAVNLWEVVSGQIRMTLVGHSSTVNRVTFSPDGRLVATCSEDLSVRVWDAATGKELRRFDGHLGQVYGVAFSPDGRALASSSADTTVLIWDVSGLAVPIRVAHRLDRAQRDQFWKSLAGENAREAYQAVQALSADPELSVAYIRERVRSTPRFDEARIAQMLNNLNNDKYAARERASDNLARLREIAAPAMAKHLEGPIPLEARYRIERILASLPEVPNSQVLQTLRAIEVLESIGSDDARRVIQSLVDGEPAARQTRDSRMALERMSKVGERR